MGHYNSPPEMCVYVHVCVCVCVHACLPACLRTWGARRASQGAEMLLRNGEVPSLTGIVSQPCLQPVSLVLSGPPDLFLLFR